MTTGSSTIPHATGSTVEPPQTDEVAQELQQIIESEWRAAGYVDLVATLRRRPKILRDRSLLLNLAVREFQTLSADNSVNDLEQHCQRFREFGGSIERSILRQLDVQRVVEGFLTSPESAADIHWPDVGQRFGKFHVVEKLGFGSLARVYLCLECDVGNRQVVVKASPHAAVEASILGKLNHPNITPIHSTGYVEESDLHFICMPFCGRSTLGDLLDLAFGKGKPSAEHLMSAVRRWDQLSATVTRSPLRRRLAQLACRTYIDCVLDLAISIADALEHAHSCRILHGDLKPSNVLLSCDGRPLLLDFNLSQDFSDSLRKCGGTLTYMPPEYLRFVVDANNNRVDPKFHPAPDIFSFGALMYELLCGKPPLSLPNGDFDTKQIAGDFIEQYRRGVPKLDWGKLLISCRLATIIQKCLAFDRNDRPPSMSQIKDALTGDRRWNSTVVRRARSRPKVFSTIAGVGLAAVVGAASYAALQPPRHERLYSAGISAAGSGDLSNAIEQFDEALSVAPSFVAARYARARTYLHLSDLDLAMKDFGELAKGGDAKSMAMLAYSFNVQDIKTAAILWYMKALENGVTDAAVYNNLGACYLVTQTHLTQADQIASAEKYLRLAHESSLGSSIQVQLNMVRFATKKADVDPNHDPSWAWQEAFAVLRKMPQDRIIRAHISAWYRSLTRFARRSGVSDNLCQEFRIERPACEAFEKIHLSNSTAPSNPPLIDKPRSGSELLSSDHFYFIEPFSLSRES
jgi:serine/threonine protein kinase